VQDDQVFEAHVQERLSGAYALGAQTFLQEGDMNFVH